MDKEELKNKYTERAKIFQQAMESCKSSSPMDCIEWFADRISELEKDYKVLQTSYNILKDNDEKIIKEMGEQIEKMRNCGNCNGIVEGGIRTKKCKFCIDSKDLPRWELRDD